MAIDLPSGVDVGDELVSIGECSGRFQLKVLLGMSNPNPVILCELVKQVDALMKQLVPGIAFSIFKWQFALSAPFFE